MNHIFAVLVNGALVSAAITLAELVGLRLFRRHLNAATRYTIWWITLAIAAILPFAKNCSDRRCDIPASI